MTDQYFGPMVEVCDECRMDPAEVTDPVAALAGLGRRFEAPLRRFLPGEDGEALVRTRPAPDVWSPLEYACHVRDVLRTFHDRTRGMARTDGFDFGWCDHEAPLPEYASADASEVAAEIAAESAAYAATLAALSDEQRRHRGQRRPGEFFTVDELAVYGVHEARHHLLDIGRGLRAARGR